MAASHSPYTLEDLDAIIGALDNEIAESHRHVDHWRNRLSGLTVSRDVFEERRKALKTTIATDAALAPPVGSAALKPNGLAEPDPELSPSRSIPDRVLTVIQRWKRIAQPPEIDDELRKHDSSIRLNASSESLSRLYREQGRVWRDKLGSPVFYYGLPEWTEEHNGRRRFKAEYVPESIRNRGQFFGGDSSEEEEEEREEQHSPQEQG